MRKFGLGIQTIFRKYAIDLKIWMPRLVREIVEYTRARNIFRNVPGTGTEGQATKNIAIFAT